MKFGKLASLIIFLSFAGAGIMLVFSVAFDALGLPSRYMGLSVVLSLAVLLPVTKLLAVCTGADEETARWVALLVGILSTVLLYLAHPKAGV